MLKLCLAPEEEKRMIIRNDRELYIVPIGGYFVTAKSMYLQTVLGSCVSVVLYDKKRKIGGMNHIILPGSFMGTNLDDLMIKKDTKYGIFSIEKLISDIIKIGAKKEDIVAKIYGASYMGKKNIYLDIQSANVEFVKAFLSMAKIIIVENITLQEDAQKIIFDTETGEVEVIWLSNEL